MNRTCDKFHISLTDAGKLILRGICFVALAALIVPAFGVLSALVSVMLTALIIGFILRPRIQISGDLPDRIIVNQTVHLKYLVKNIGRFPVYNLFITFETLPETIEQVEIAAMVSRLGAGETTEVIVTIKPRRRGHYRIKQPVSQSSFPFNLFNFGRSRTDYEDLIVLPAYSFLRVLLRHINPHTRAESSMYAGCTGSFQEYAGNRPFMPGDSRRRIDARAWARLAAPATKEYHENYDSRTALIFDINVPKNLRNINSGQIEEFEAAVSLCASMAFTIKDDSLIDMLLIGSDIHDFTNWPRNERLDKVHEILSGIEPSTDNLPEQMVPVLADNLNQMSEVIYFLFGWKKAYRQLLELTGQAGCRSTIFIFGEDGNVDSDPYERAWTENIRILSPEDIQAEQVMQS